MTCLFPQLPQNTFLHEPFGLLLIGKEQVSIALAPTWGTLCSKITTQFQDSLSKAPFSTTSGWFYTSYSSVFWISLQNFLFETFSCSVTELCSGRFSLTRGLRLLDCEFPRRFKACHYLGKKIRQTSAFFGEFHFFRREEWDIWSQIMAC